MKCHDLKHQIARIRNLASSGQVDEHLKQLEKSVMIYDSFLKTGNDALDIVLTEKMLICEKYKIRLTCTVDGSNMNILREEDIFSLFGNLLDNAIESVRNIDESRRLISLKVMKVANSLIVHMDNCCESEVKFEGGLPISTKTDKINHGYGVKSVCYIVEQYGGAIKMSCNNKMFRTNIIIPFPEKES